MNTAQFEQFTVAAETALRRDGAGALASTGWLACLDCPDDPDARSALFALFVAEGRCLAITPALHLLAASPYRRAAGLPADPTAGYGFVIGTTSEIFWVAAPTDPSITSLLVEMGNGAVGSFDLDASCNSPDTTTMDPDAHRLLAVSRQLPVVMSLYPSGQAAALSRAVTKLAIGFEIAGACEMLLAVSSDYAKNRRQFGVAVGTFQAVQHLLAAAAVDLGGLKLACSAAIARKGPIDPYDASICVAAAIRNGRRVLDATSQVFGAIGFTWEHMHHRYQRRILTIGSLLGTQAQLLADVGRIGTRPFSLVDAVAGLESGQ